jgi:cytidylate kinase
MRIICVSRGSHGCGIQLAEKLAAKLGYTCISRETLTDEASLKGILVGRIETAVVKKRPISEDMEIQVDRFKAFVTASLCERAAAGEGIVYHGRTGHLVLPGVSHVFRVRAIAAMEERITLAMSRMNISREKAKQYIAQVEEDRRRWVRMLYNVDWDDPSLYDIVINTQHLSVDNASSALVEIAQLPEYQPTPASRQALENLELASRCRLAIGSDERTAAIKAAVKAEKGHVSVTYLPRQANIAAAIPDVLEGVRGVKTIVCTVATTNVIFLQERFKSGSESLQNLIDLAEKWNAAVEVVRLSHSEEPATVVQQTVAPPAGVENGGILEDEPFCPTSDEEKDDFGLPETVDKLIRVGRAGGCRTIYGGTGELVRKLTPDSKCSLIVVGDIFLDQPEGVRKRMTRDTVSLLSDKLRVPVIEPAALKSRYLFGPRQLAGMLGYLVVAALIYFLVLSHQGPVIGFLTSHNLVGRVVAAAAVGLFVPLIAFSLGGFYRNVLKMVRIE